MIFGRLQQKNRSAGLPVNGYDFGQGIQIDGSKYATINNIAGEVFPKNGFSFVSWFRILVHKTPLGGLWTSRTASTQSNYIRIQLRAINSIASKITVAILGSTVDAGYQGYDLVIPGGVNTQRHCLIVTYDGVSLRYYFDGVLLTTLVYSILNFPDNFYTTNEIGRDGAVSGWETNSVIGESRLISQVLTDNQAKLHWNKGNGLNNLDLLSHLIWYKFLGNGNDSSGNNRNLTLSGSPTYTTF